MTKEERDSQRKLKVLRHAERPAMWPRPADTSACAGQASIAGKPLTSNVAKLY